MLSLKLFTEFLSDINNDLFQEFGVPMSDRLLFYLLYADDLALFSDTFAGLQVQLNGILKFCEKWHMILSLAKSKVMVFNKRVEIHEPFTFFGQPLEIVDEYKYLGVIFSSKHANSLCKTYKLLSQQAQKGLFAVNKYGLKSLGKLTPKIAFKMFNTQILPILEYGCEVWFQYKGVKQLEQVQLNFLKSTLGVRTQTSNDAVLSDTGHFPLLYRQSVRVLKYWLRIINLHEDSLLYSAYKCLYQLHTFGSVNWVTNIKMLLEACNLHDLWDSHSVVNINETMRTVKEFLSSKYMNSCMDRVQNSGEGCKLRTFKLFKNEYRLESYLLCTSDVKIIHAIARFRLSSHNLCIETGRHARPVIPANARYCLFCPKIVEDEFHFLVTCQMYKNERKKLFQVCSRHIDGFDSGTDQCKFKMIMSCKHYNVQFALGKYLCLATK